jgi:hypothetical protein
VNKQKHNLSCKNAFLTAKKWLHVILQKSSNTSCHNFWLELSNSYVLIEKKIWTIPRHDSHVEKVITVIPPPSPLLRNHAINIFIRFRSCAGFENRLSGIYWMLLCKFYLFYYIFIWISDDFFLLKCWREAQGNNLCAYYFCKNIHGLIDP